MFSFVSICSPLTLGGHNLCMSSLIIYTQATGTASPALLEEEVCSHGKAGAGKHLHPSSGTTKYLPLPNSSWRETGDTLVFFTLQNTSSFISENNVFHALPWFLRNKQCTTEAKHRMTITHRAGFCYKALSSGLQHKHISSCRTPPTAGSAGGPVLQAAALPSQTWCLSFGLSSASSTDICICVAAFCKSWAVSPMLNILGEYLLS